VIDTLTVVTNSIPDTLRIVLSTSDKPSFWIQYSPLLVAVLIVVISSSINLFIAAKQRKVTEKQIKENKEIEEKKRVETREIEEKKIKSDLIHKDKQNWRKEVRIILYNLFVLMDNMISKNPNKMVLYNDDLTNLFNLHAKLQLYFNLDNKLHKKLLDHIHSISETEEQERDRDFMVNYIAMTRKTSYEIIKDINESICDI
jgi:hypothetical protein